MFVGHFGPFRPHRAWIVQAPGYNIGMCTVQLSPHVTTPCPFIHGLDVEVNGPVESQIRLVFALRGDLNRLLIPPLSRTLRRTDGLWRHTCFEIFLKPVGGTAYWEFNFSPSGDWAVYRFDDYRAGQSSPTLTRPPSCRTQREAERLELEARIDLAPLGHEGDARDFHLALSAVIESREGDLAYWACRHPAGKPDFHHPDSFARRLEPVSAMPAPGDPPH